MPNIQFQEKKPIVLSVGGSLIVPNGGPDAEFLKQLKNTIGKLMKKGHRFVLVSGGGKTARHYIDAADAIRGKSIPPDDLDWLGIHATRLNGHLLRTIFREDAHPVVIKDPRRTPKSSSRSVLIGAGWRPGWSTDYMACRMAKRLGVKKIVNLSNVEAVYDVDPRKSKDAKPLTEISWEDYRVMVGDDWHPGKSAPFDPVASKFCQRHKMQVAMVGDDFKNFEKVLLEKEFYGTLMG